jgi:hypothetical protein
MMSLLKNMEIKSFVFKMGLKPDGVLRGFVFNGINADAIEFTPGLEFVFNGMNADAIYQCSHWIGILFNCINAVVI